MPFVFHPGPELLLNGGGTATLGGLGGGKAILGFLGGGTTTRSRRSGGFGTMRGPGPGCALGFLYQPPGGQGIRTDAMKVCRAAFGEPRQTSGSRVVFKTPWAGDPRINLQNKAARAKPYQVRQILAALEKLQTL
ncbi:MAG TPA: hypothetical protein VF285_06670 [Castellaniella sp.]|uniref:hypothetical protein n=1 Tax=Castellaniella sp. TaxID=1955812 RepID=UPI002F0CE5EA